MRRFKERSARREAITEKNITSLIAHAGKLEAVVAQAITFLDDNATNMDGDKDAIKLYKAAKAVLR